MAGIRTIGIQHEQGPGAYGFPHSLYPGSIFTDAQGTHLHLDACDPLFHITLHLSLEIRDSFSRFIISAGNINRHAPSVFPQKPVQRQSQGLGLDIPKGHVNTADCSGADSLAPCKLRHIEPVPEPLRPHGILSNQPVFQLIHHHERIYAQYRTGKAVSCNLLVCLHRDDRQAAVGVGMHSVGDGTAFLPSEIFLFYICYLHMMSFTKGNAAKCISPFCGILLLFLPAITGQLLSLFPG